MRFLCERDLLLNCINTTQRAVSSKSLIPALEGILLEADAQSVKMTGYDLEMGIVSSLPCQVEEKGSVILNGKIFGDIIRNFPSGIVLVSVEENLKTTIRCQAAEFSIMAMKADDFPELPVINPEKSFSMGQDILKSMIEQTIFAVSQNDAKPVHTGALFEIENELLNLVAVDGYRLALRKEKVDFSDSFSFIVPGKTLSEVMKILNEDEESNLTLSVTKKHILFKVDQFIVISRLLEGDFLNYRNAIPQNSAIVSTVDVKKFEDSIERASLLIFEKNRNPVRVTIDDTSLHIDCVTQVGRVHDEMEIESNGGEIEIGFNNRYLLDALKACREDKVKLHFNSPLTPCVITPVSGEKYLFLVLPVKLKANE
jgi:DNA polymerase-3 subunit beta